MCPVSLQQDFFELQLRRMQESIFQNALRERMWKIEGINAEAKNQHGLKRARYRGINKVQIQANMVGAILNIKRIVALCYALFRAIKAIITINQSNIPMVTYKKSRIMIIHFLYRDILLAI